MLDEYSRDFLQGKQGFAQNIYYIVSFALKHIKAMIGVVVHSNKFVYPILSIFVLELCNITWKYLVCKMTIEIDPRGCGPHMYPS